MIVSEDLVNNNLRRGRELGTAGVTGPNLGECSLERKKSPVVGFHRPGIRLFVLRTSNILDAKEQETPNSLFSPKSTIIREAGWARQCILFR